MANAGEDTLHTFDRRSNGRGGTYDDMYLEQICTATRLLGTKDWHQSTDTYVRNHYVLKMIKSMQDIDTEPVSEETLKTLIRTARKIESDNYHAAEMRCEYYIKVAKAIKKIDAERLIQLQVLNNATESAAAAAAATTALIISSKTKQSNSVNRTLFKRRTTKTRRTANSKIWHEYVSTSFRNEHRNNLAASMVSVASIANRDSQELAELAIKMELEAYDTCGTMVDYMFAMRDMATRVIKRKIIPDAETWRRILALSNSPVPAVWREEITPEVRSANALEFSNLMIPNEKPEENMEAARNIEDDLFSRAKSQSDYARLVNEKKQELQFNADISECPPETPPEAETHET